MKVLIVEDDRRLGEFLKQGFGECRYTATWVRTCKEASEALSETPFDAVVLDLSLPDGDGLEMLHQWRKSGFNEPVLILSARVSMEDRVKGLDLGADDYLPKPFGLEELLARVRSLVRRQSTVKHTVLEHAGIQLDLLGHTVQVNGQTVELTSREYALLEVFMQNHGRILARTATVTLASLFLAGYVLLENQLVHGLDLLNETGFKQIEAHLGPDYATLNPSSIEQRIREVTDSASTLFYIDVHVPSIGDIFRSTNLGGRNIPDLPGEQLFTVQVDGIGELRVAEFHKDPFEVTIATPLRPVRDVMASYVRVCLSLLAVMLIASALIGLGLTRLVLLPVRLMRDTANRIRSDNLSERIPVPEVRDEVSDLARLLNQMFDRLEASFVQIRRFTADASHELKIPLSLIRLHSEKMLGDGTLAPAHREAVQVQLEEIARLNRIIEELLLLSRADAHALKLDLKPENPAALLQAFAQDASVLAEHHGRRFACEHRGEGSVALDPKWMRQVLLNLLTNAIHVSPSGGLISLQSGLSSDGWRVSVEDEGPGLTADQRERMFERFVRLVTVDTEYPGSGLGLAICRSIVDLHGGRISASPTARERGLRVLIEIPTATA